MFVQPVYAPSRNLAVQQYPQAVIQQPQQIINPVYHSPGVQPQVVIQQQQPPKTNNLTFSPPRVVKKQIVIQEPFQVPPSNNVSIQQQQQMVQQNKSPQRLPTFTPSAQKITLQPEIYQSDFINQQQHLETPQVYRSVYPSEHIVREEPPPQQVHQSQVQDRNPFSFPDISCPTHVHQRITNICKAKECIEPLCPECLTNHINLHNKNRASIPEIETVESQWKNCVRQCENILFKMNRDSESGTMIKEELEMMQRLKNNKQQVLHDVNNYFQQLEVAVMKQINNKVEASDKLFFDKANNSILNIYNSLYTQDCIKAIIDITERDLNYQQMRSDYDQWLQKYQTESSYIQNLQTNPPYFEQMMKDLQKYNNFSHYRQVVNQKPIQKYYPKYDQIQEKPYQLSQNNHEIKGSYLKQSGLSINSQNNQPENQQPFSRKLSNLSPAQQRPRKEENEVDYVQKQIFGQDYEQKPFKKLSSSRNFNPSEQTPTSKQNQYQEEYTQPTFNNNNNDNNNQQRKQSDNSIKQKQPKKIYEKYQFEEKFNDTESDITETNY